MYAGPIPNASTESTAKLAAPPPDKTRANLYQSPGGPRQVGGNSGEAVGSSMTRQVYQDPTMKSSSHGLANRESTYQREDSATGNEGLHTSAVSSPVMHEPCEEDIPVSTPVSFADSRLPKLFECPETKTPAPPAPMKLATAWQLYGDDHQTLLHELSTTGGGSAGGAHHNSGDSVQMVFDPVLISTVTTLEEFWRLWRYISPPSTSNVPFTYSWFRKDITPDWEHPRNRRGGTISLYIYDRDRSGLNDRQTFDDVFQVVLLACVGEVFGESSSTVNGVMLKLRQAKPATLQIWTAHGDFSKLKIFAKSLREILNPLLGEKMLQKIDFFLHPRNQNSLASRMPKPSGPDLSL